MRAIKITVHPRTENKPGIVHRPRISYAFIPHRVPLAEVGKVSAASFGRIAEWLDRRGQAPTGSPFLRYRRIDMAETLDIETGIPVEAAGEADDGIGFGEIPAGRYARLLWAGPYDTLIDGNAHLVAWGRQRGIAWDMTPSAEGGMFAARMETYLVGPAQEPNPAKWLTEIAIRIVAGESSSLGEHPSSVRLSRDQA